MELKTVIYDKKSNGILWIRFNRPEVLNAQNRQIVEDFLTALKSAQADKDVKVVILKGEGRAFCSGADLGEPLPIGEAETEFLEILQDTTRTIRRMRKVTIAAVHGYALGAGCEWAMNCDIRIAAEGAKFGFPETGVGATVTNGGTKLLPQLIGMGRAKEMVYFGDFIEAKQAEQWGLVNKVVSIDNLGKTATDMAMKIMEKSFAAIIIAKRALDSGVDMGLEEVLEQEARDAMITCHTQEMSSRFKEKLAGTKGPKKQ
jgi:enoyl-CoA hydratase/carnithine racemase